MKYKLSTEKEEEIYRDMIKAYERYPQNTCKIYDKRLKDSEIEELLKKFNEED